MRRTQRLRWLAAGLAFVCAAALVECPPLGAPRSAYAGRRVKRHTSLTGVWSGAYSYPPSAGSGAPVAFNARLEEAGASFTGDTDEPNTYANPSAPRLFATVAGSRSSLDVRFVKTMDGTGGVSHAINYVGVADSDLARIDGTWSLASGFSGSFFMERAGVEAEAAASRAASATE